VWATLALVRPSYVLGGQRMAHRVINDDEVESAVVRPCSNICPGNKILADSFPDRRQEAEIDGISLMAKIST